MTAEIRTPAHRPSTSPQCKLTAKVEKMSKLSGADFDKAYVKDQVKDHQKDVQDFQLEATYGTDPVVKEHGASVNSLWGS